MERDVTLDSAAGSYDLPNTIPSRFTTGGPSEAKRSNAFRDLAAAAAAAAPPPPPPPPSTAFTGTDHIVVGPSALLSEDHPITISEEGGDARHPYTIAASRAKWPEDHDKLHPAAATAVEAVEATPRGNAPHPSAGLSSSNVSLSSTKTLSLIHQHITALRHLKDLPRLTSLRSLNLHMNNIRELDNSALRSLHLLEELDLSGNDIAVVPHDAFSGLVRLSRLNLSSNRVRVLERQCFAALPALRVVSLAFNVLEEVEAFQSIPSRPDHARPAVGLEEVDLSGNRLASIRSVETGLSKHRHSLVTLRLRISATYYKAMLPGTNSTPDTSASALPDSEAYPPTTPGPGTRMTITTTCATLPLLVQENPLVSRDDERDAARSPTRPHTGHPVNTTNTTAAAGNRETGSPRTHGGQEAVRGGAHTGSAACVLTSNERQDRYGASRARGGGRGGKAHMMPGDECPPTSADSWGPTCSSVPPGLPWYAERLLAFFPALTMLDDVVVAVDPLRAALERKEQEEKERFRSSARWTGSGVLPPHHDADWRLLRSSYGTRSPVSRSFSAPSSRSESPLYTHTSEKVHFGASSTRHQGRRALSESPRGKGMHHHHHHHHEQQQQQQQQEEDHPTHHHRKPHSFSSPFKSSVLPQKPRRTRRPDLAASPPLSCSSKSTSTATSPSAARNAVHTRTSGAAGGGGGESCSQKRRGIRQDGLNDSRQQDPTSESLTSSSSSSSSSGQRTHHQPQRRHNKKQKKQPLQKEPPHAESVGPLPWKPKKVAPTTITHSVATETHSVNVLLTTSGPPPPPSSSSTTTLPPGTLQPLVFSSSSSSFSSSSSASSLHATFTPSQAQAALPSPNPSGHGGEEGEGASLYQANNGSQGQERISRERIRTTTTAPPTESTPAEEEEKKEEEEVRCRSITEQRLLLVNQLQEECQRLKEELHNRDAITAASKLEVAQNQQSLRQRQLEWEGQLLQAEAERTKLEAKVDALRQELQRKNQEALLLRRHFAAEQQRMQQAAEEKSAAVAAKAMEREVEQTKAFERERDALVSVAQQWEAYCTDAEKRLRAEAAEQNAVWRRYLSDSQALAALQLEEAQSRCAVLETSALSPFSLGMEGEGGLHALFPSATTAGVGGAARASSPLSSWLRGVLATYSWERQRWQQSIGETRTQLEQQFHRTLARLQEEHQRVLKKTATAAQALLAEERAAHREAIEALHREMTERLTGDNVGTITTPTTTSAAAAADPLPSPPTVVDDEKSPSSSAPPTNHESAPPAEAEAEVVCVEKKSDDTDDTGRLTTPRSTDMNNHRNIKVEDRLRAACDVVMETQRTLHRENDRLLRRVRELEQELQTATQTHAKAEEDRAAAALQVTNDCEALRREVRHLQADLQRKDEAFQSLEEEAVEKLSVKRRRIAELEEELERERSRAESSCATAATLRERVATQQRWLQQVSDRVTGASGTTRPMLEHLVTEGGGSESESGCTDHHDGHGQQANALLSIVDQWSREREEVVERLRRYEKDQQRLLEALRLARDQLVLAVEEKDRLRAERVEDQRRLRVQETELSAVKVKLTEIEHQAKVKHVATLEALTQVIRSDLPPSVPAAGGGTTPGTGSGS